MLVDTNDSPIRSLLFLRLPFRAPVFSLVPVSPTTIGHRWKSLRNPSSHEIVSPSFLFWLLFLFFFVQLKIKNFILESSNFASFYKSFIPISFLLLFFNFKFLTFLPFDGDGGRIELECFEKFKFSVSLFVWSPFIETSPSWLAPPRSLKCSSRNQLPSTVRILLIMPLLHPSFHPLIKRSNYVSLKNLTAISAFPNRYTLSTERSIDRVQVSIIIAKKEREEKKRSITIED